MQVHLPEEIEAFLKSLVARGRYLTEGEAILDALDLLKDREALDEIHRDHLKKLIDDGMKDIEEGRSAPLDMPAIMAKVDARLRAKQKQEVNRCPG